jgi:oligopeptide/dipeptide ABC transporter ATP-binding protein
METLLEVRDLKTYFYRPDGVVKAVDGISYSISPGETMALVGESGSGKSVGVKTLMGLIRPPGRVAGGEALFQGRDLLRLSPREFQKVRGREIGMVFQDPMSSLNPTLTVGRQIMEPMLWHGLCDRRTAKKRAIELLEMVGIPAPEQRLNEYPFQFSGGMRQRVMIAMALACRPKLLIADEPTTALDVTVQAQILDLLREMQKELGMAIILITHDFGVAAEFSQKVAVMYAGRIVETSPMREFLKGPRHPYSQGLLRSTPEVGRAKERLEPIPGSPPNLMSLGAGCPFAPRCAMASSECLEARPELTPVGPNRMAACFKVLPEGVTAHG